MNILAVDSSTAVAGVAITNGDTVLAERSIGFGRKHSTVLAPMIRGILDDTGLEPEDIGLYAAVVGPGSFTGLRIGISMVKAMAYALDKPVCGVSTLDSLAYGVVSSGHLICPIMDARNSQVYAAIYRWTDDGPERLTDYLADDISVITEAVYDIEGHVVFTGDAVALHRNYLVKALAARCSFAHTGIALNRASCAALLARRMYDSGQFTGSFELLPVYLRKSQAERMRALDGRGVGNG